MFHHGWQRHGYRLRQLADGGAVGLCEALQNCPPRRADKSAEDAIEPSAMVHHLVNYKLLALRVSNSRCTQMGREGRLPPKRGEQHKEHRKHQACPPFGSVFEAINGHGIA